MRRIVIGLATAALLAVAVAASAQATVYEKFRFEDEWAFTEDCGFAVDVAGSATGTFVLRAGKNKDEGVFPFTQQYRFSETWTNPANGEWFVIRGNGVVNEVKATRVEGSVFLFHIVDAGQPFVVEDSEGNVIERSRGSVRGTFLFDTEGDSVPGGIYLEFFEPRVSGPHPGLDKHPCDYAVELIG
jgi:hypothetical protein